MRWPALLFAFSLAAAEVEIRYIAHAAFQVTSPAGVRLVIDPYNSHVWLGYRFPENVAADAVLVSHPHFDHDAHYYIRGLPAVFRHPGEYRVGDVEIRGVRGKHADPYGTEFGQINTIWVIETAGVRLAHLGDNGPLSEDAARQLGRVDVLFAPVDETEHILKFAEIDAILARLRPRVVVPMHYRMEPGLGPEDLGGIDAWLKRQSRAHQAGNRVRLSVANLPAQTTVYRFQPAPDVRPWPAQFWDAIRAVREFNRLLDRTKGKPSREQLAGIGPRLVESTSRAPGFIAGWHARAVLARLDGRADAAIELLQKGLAASHPDDTERTTLARSLLAELLDEQGRRAEARVQWLTLLGETQRHDLIEKARRSLGEVR